MAIPGSSESGTWSRRFATRGAFRRPSRSSMIRPRSNRDTGRFVDGVHQPEHGRTRPMRSMGVRAFGRAVLVLAGFSLLLAGCTSTSTGGGPGNGAGPTGTADADPGTL